MPGAGLPEVARYYTPDPQASGTGSCLLGAQALLHPQQRRSATGTHSRNLGSAISWTSEPLHRAGHDCTDPTKIRFAKSGCSGRGGVQETLSSVCSLAGEQAMQTGASGNVGRLAAMGRTIDLRTILRKRELTSGGFPGCGKTVSRAMLAFHTNDARRCSGETWPCSHAPPKAGCERRRRVASETDDIRGGSSTAERSWFIGQEERSQRFLAVQAIIQQPQQRALPLEVHETSRFPARGTMHTTSPPDTLAHVGTGRIAGTVLKTRVKFFSAGPEAGRARP